MALFSSSLMAGLVVVTFSVVGADVAVVTVVGIVMDDVVMIDDVGVDVCSKVAISVVDISAMLALVTASVWCRADVDNSSSPLVWIIGPTVPRWEPLPTWDSTNSAVGLVTKVRSTSFISVVLLVSVLLDIFCIVSFTIDKVTLALAVWLVMVNGMSVLGSVKELLGVFIRTLGVVVSTLVPVVRIVYSQVLCFVYEMRSVVVDGSLVGFTVGLLVLTLGVPVDIGWSIGVATLVVLAVLQDLQQMRWNAGIMQYCWSIAILHNIERSVRHREPITQQSEGIRRGEPSRYHSYDLYIGIFGNVSVYATAGRSKEKGQRDSLFRNNGKIENQIRETLRRHFLTHSIFYTF